MSLLDFAIHGMLHVLDDTPSYPWSQELSASDALPTNTIKKIITFLASHPNQEMEQKLQDKIVDLNGLLPKEIDEVDRTQLEIIQRVVSLSKLKTAFNAPDPTALAKSEAKIAPEPSKNLDQITASAFYIQALGILSSMILEWVYRMESWGRSMINRYTEIPTSITDLLSIVTFTKMFYEKIISLHQLPHKYIPTPWAYIVELMAMSGFIGLYRFYRKNNFCMTRRLRGHYNERRDKFINLTDKARLGTLSKTIGRTQEMEALKLHVSSSPLEKGSLIFLIGPPGVGKTQLVEGLAAILDNITIYSVNTAELDSFTYEIDHIQAATQAQAQRPIFFFDEAAATHRGSKSPNQFLHLFKTKPQAMNMTAILATTEEEYKQFIEIDPAFVERVRPIHLNSLDKDTTKLVLQDIVSRTKTEITSEAIDKILEITETHDEYKDRANPRKSIQLLEVCIKQSCVQHSPSPKTPGDESAAEAAFHKKQFFCQSKNDQDPAWITSEEGKKEMKERDALEEKMNQSKAKHAPEIQQQDRFRKLKELEKEYKLEKDRLVHQLSSSTRNSPNAEKRYLFLKFVLIPRLREILQTSPIAFKVDVPLVENLVANNPAVKPPNSTSSKQLEQV